MVELFTWLLLVVKRLIREIQVKKQPGGGYHPPIYIYI